MTIQPDKMDMDTSSGEAFTARRRLRISILFIFLLATLLIMVTLNVTTGSVGISPSEIWSILITRGASGGNGSIIWRIRLPRLLMAAILGGALALSGFLLQTFFANPIAGPFVLGISSGAKLIVALLMVFFLERVRAASSWALVGAAFCGALISTLFILALSRRLRHMATLLVAGIMVGYICSAITDFVVTFADDQDIVNLRGWSLGSFSGMSWEGVMVTAIIVGAGLIMAILLSKPMSAYQLGEGYARSVGVNTGAFRVALILLSSLLSACVTAFAGPISFVGIAVPHLIKRAANTSRPLVVIPATFLGGAVFCMGCDLIARTAFAPTELNISTVTAIFGAPVVIGMMLRRHRGA